MNTDDPYCLEGPGRTPEEAARNARELNAVAPTPADKFALMFGRMNQPAERTTPTVYENRGGEVWERHADGRRELFAADIIKKLTDLERQLAAERQLADRLAESLKVCFDDLRMELEIRLKNPEATWCSLRDADEALTAWKEARQ